MRIYWIFWCICNQFDFTTPFSSKCCSICNRLAVIQRGSFGYPQFRGIRGALSGWRLCQSKAHPRLPNSSQYKVLLYLPPFGRNSNVKLRSPNSTPRSRGLGRPMELKIVPVRMCTFKFNFYIHTIGLSFTVWPQCTTWQTDKQKAIRIGRLYIL